MPVPGLLKKYYKYFTRTELDIQHRLTNVVILAALLVQIPAIILSTLVGTNLLGILADVAIVALMAIFLCIINKRPDTHLPIVILVVLVDFIVMPFMYCYCGGRASGMVLWMLFGSIYASLLLSGIIATVVLVLNGIVFALCICVEFYYPEFISFLPTYEAEMADVITAFAIVSIILGLTFKYQSVLYEKQNKELLENERKLLELNEALKLDFQAKSEFIESMSRDIRVPINTILGMNAMIVKDESDPVVQSYAKDIDAAARQLFSTVSDIFDFSNIEAGNFTINDEEYDTIALIDECFSVASPKAFEKKLDFKVENTPSMPSRLKGDFERIKQITINLLTNAVKYTETGYVKFVVDYETLQNNRIMMRIAVVDTGIGIINAAKEQLFGDSTKIDNKVQKKVEGTSLGLILVKEIAELMGGSVAVDSEIGAGSTFTVRIPQTVISDTPAGRFNAKEEFHKTEKKGHEELFTAENANVLVVDDVRVNLNVVKLLLRDTKIKLDLAESGAEAVEYVKRKHYDLILMDHLMPDMDGIETLKAIRSMEDSDNRFVPIVALTANAVAGAEKLYYEAGFCDYLTKPIKISELERSLVKYLPENLVSVKGN